MPLFKLKNNLTRKFQFLYPFLIPLFLGVFFLENWITIGVFGLFLFVFYPFILVRLWRCKPIEDEELILEMNKLAKKGNFKHAGFLEWTAVNHLLTAAIVGTVPHFRYVLFSEPMLRRFSRNSVLAVLAHEMGHSYWKHLWIYPFILIGGILFSSSVAEYLSGPNVYLMYFIFFVCFGLWIRIVFGFFSRQFERQSDLYGLKLGLPLNWMTSALEEVCLHSGRSPLKPNWHHGSVQERINFLKKMEANPDLISLHNRQTACYIILYFIFFFGLCCFVYGMA